MVAEVEPEMVGEEPIIAEGITRGEIEEEDMYSGVTVVLSEGGTEVIKDGEEKGEAEKVNEEEEVVQPIGDREERVVAEGLNWEENIEQVMGNREMEMEQDFGYREEVVLVTDDEEVVEEEQPTEVAGQRTGGHRYSPIGQLEETLATSGWMAVRSVGSEERKK